MAIPIPEKRIAEFERFGFGMFVHWGLYSQLGRGEWVQYNERIPKEEYHRLFPTFRAEKFEPRKWAQIAKAAGAKYITLTTRHHEGFSLYDTKGLSDYDAPHSGAKRDLIREFVDACRAEDIVPFFYHTTLDWDKPEFNGDFPKYLQYLRDSVEILCTQYGKIGGLWFDGNWSRPGDDWEEDRLYAVIRRHQPEAIIVNNTGIGARGQLGNPEIDSVTFEQGRPTPMDREGMTKYIAAEMCHTMNDHWGYSDSDVNYKSLPSLIETLCACRRVGANYLLNVGPDGEGEIPLQQEALLRGIGKWMEKVGSDPVRLGKPCGITGEGKDFVLKNGERLWFFLSGLPYGGITEKTFRGVSGRIRDVKWTDSGETLSFTQNGDEVKLGCTGYPHEKNLVFRIAEATIG